MQEEKRYRAAAIIDLAALEWNINEIKKHLAKGVRLMAVVKADAYGHGFSGLYPIFKKCGVDQYAVAFWQEGARLREQGVTEPILILGDTMDEEMTEVVRYDLMPAIFTESMARAYSEAVCQAGICGRVHIKLDTGMGRIGFPCCEETVETIQRIGELPGIQLEGIFSHFARADETDKTEARKQYERYVGVLSMLEHRGVRIPIRHIDNSAAIMEMEDTQQSMVRAGIILYGLYPSSEVDQDRLSLKPVLRWISHVSYVKTVPAGTPIGYGGTYVTSRPSVIATIPVGYADGYSRGLSNRGKVQIRGQEAPILGRVCMDQFMVDVTHIPDVQRGDPVILLGEEFGAEQMADLLGTISYEVVCDISGRVPRIYQN